jgi:hypothetical protein
MSAVGSGGKAVAMVQWPVIRPGSDHVLYGGELGGTSRKRIGEGPFEVGAAVSIEPCRCPGNICGRSAKEGGASECAVPSNMGAGWFVDVPGHQMSVSVERITGAMEIPLPFLVGFRNPFL